MEQLKYFLGPFELFAAIIGGSPFIVAGFLLYNPVESLADLAPVIQSSGTLAISFTFLFLSYIIGGTVQTLSWRYFLLLCHVFKQEYLYMDSQLRERDKKLKQAELGNTSSLDFEDRLVLQLQQKIGLPKKMRWINARLKAYLRENNSPSVTAAEMHTASHIMYRNLSLGCLILGFVSLINTFRVSSLELLIVAPLFGYVAYLMFRRSVSFKKWQNRELLLGFYFAVTKEIVPRESD
ncbi:hypothetical protein D0962_05430 [Leptolyngbyaceae cyanobacterium CCMR0082]|uniref:Uncharacterized protein n=1 Tax=Adonisia turfae CCMR0082 TaxID=2304604 RepID=A0A6M0S2U3_9CYAN|nr:hypothetical protein [Adonisia turfae]MDV3347542.1 hypothetical protein [Leptothoe sp. LEGE 181152]NEZ62222.1 hypothetical protein [Adonisia turfae CCMR0082]